MENMCEIPTEKISDNTTELQTELSVGISQQKKILNPKEYEAICDYISKYYGLVIECELEMITNKFTNIERQTLKSITQTRIIQDMRVQHWRQLSAGKKYLHSFEDLSANNWNTKILINLSIKENVLPVALCRLILQEKYGLKSKAQLTRLLKYPSLISDAKLSANVIQCLCSDSQDGPLLDLKRRVLGEEYEFKLKQMAKSAGMHFYDENELRRLGYDKTPDLKLILPILFKDEVVNWIESKACFGDPTTHKKYMNQQLISYSNRFGPGIVIYWFGYHTDILEISDNGTGIIIIDDFPNVEDIEFLNLDTNEMDDLAIPDENVNISTHI